MEQKAIAHLDLDSFFVSAERLHNSKLEGQPVIIVGGGDRGVVSSCSYEARGYGVTSAMPIRMAKQLCPHAILIKGDMARYSIQSQLVTDIIKERTPLYEKSSIDEFYLDISGMDRFFGCDQWAGELRDSIIKETGLPLSFGLSTNKTVAKVATGEVKPLGQLHIEKGGEKPFLAPLSIRKVPMVGDKTYRLLRSMGIARIRTVQEMDVELLSSLLGKQGVSIWKKANGIDNSPIVPYRENKSISTEQTFQQDTTDVPKLEALLVAMAKKVAFRLRKSDKVTSCIAVKVRYSEFNTHTLQAKIPYTACGLTLIKNVRELFTGLYNKRLLVRLVGVKVSGLVRGGQQINLFEDTNDMVSLYQAMDRMRQRCGSQAVVRAIGMKENLRDISPFGT
jgi:DNA polymerase-4